MIKGTYKEPGNWTHQYFAQIENQFVVECEIEIPDENIVYQIGYIQSEKSFQRVKKLYVNGILTPIVENKNLPVVDFEENEGDYMVEHALIDLYQYLGEKDHFIVLIEEGNPSYGCFIMPIISQTTIYEDDFLQKSLDFINNLNDDLPLWDSVKEKLEAEIKEVKSEED